MYKVCSLWILLLTLSTSLSDNLDMINEPCQRNKLIGQCKLLSSCPFALDLKNKINDTQWKALLCGYLNIVPVVCCPIPDGIVTEKAQEADESAIYFRQEDVTATFSPPKSTTMKIQDYMTRTPAKLPAIHTPTILPSKDICGIQAIEERIVGGEIASRHDFPWIVLLNYAKLGYACAGALITNRHVITAGHCLTIANELLSVRLGEWDLSSNCINNGCSDPPVDRKVLQQILHPNFTVSHVELNDIGILVLEEPVTFTEFIKPVCLPTSKYVASQDYTNDNSYMTAGWGRTEYGTMPTKKMKISLNAVSYDICRAIFHFDGDSRDPSVICAGGIKNKDSCAGDSGGPLIGQVTEDFKTNWYLFGITSYGLRTCGKDGVPGLYTRVSKHMAWIEEQLSKY